ncbi:hypothetical protein JCM3774_004979 [Rhodotorula dairenensis]
MLSVPAARARLPASVVSAHPARCRPTFAFPLSTSTTSAATARAAKPQASRLAPYLAELKAKYPHAEPRSLVVAFVVLHELTALVPLAVLFGAFHYLGAGAALVAWVVDETANPTTPETAQPGSRDGSGPNRSAWKETVRGWLYEAENKAERVGRRYGLFGWSKESKEEREARKRREMADEADAGAEEGAVPAVSKERLLVSGDVANAAAAYLAVKALLPLRILISLRLSPFLANRVIARLKTWRATRTSAPIRAPDQARPNP